MAIQRTIELPDHLASQLDQYLQQHPDETLSSLVVAILEQFSLESAQLGQLTNSEAVNHASSGSSPNRSTLPACVGMGSSGRRDLSEQDEQLLWQEEWQS